MISVTRGGAAAAGGLVALVVALAWLTRYVPAVLVATPPAETRPAHPADTLGDIPADQWLAAPGPLGGDELKGSPVLVEFWTYLCYNCKNVEPWMRQTHARYRDQGLVVIGVHTPEFAVERRVANVRRYMQANAIAWPVAIDNNFRVWRRYNTTNAWPAFLVYDRRGALVFRAAGEGAVHGAEAAIRRALADTAAAQGHSPAPERGIRVGAVRRGDSLIVTLIPARAFKLVRSPPNEVWLEGMTAAPAALIGEPFAGSASGDVRYFDGAARGVVRLPAGWPPARGHVIVRYCDTGTGVCLRREERFGAF